MLRFGTFGYKHIGTIDCVADHQGWNPGFGADMLRRLVQVTLSGPWFIHLQGGGSASAWLLDFTEGVSTLHV